MNKVYECVDSFVLDMVDDNGFTIENKIFVIPKGSMWVMSGDENRMVGGEVRLERIGDKSLEWIEISQERFKNHFELDVPPELDK